MIKLDYRYIYLLKYKRLIKIGISNHPSRRVREIERSIDAEVQVLFCIKVFYAQSIEDYFHKFFEKKRRPFKGSGKTEYFKLHFFDVFLLKIGLWIIKLLQIGIFLFILALTAWSVSVVV